MKSKLQKLTPEQIKKAREAIAKINLKPAPVKAPLEPIYDDVYFQGLAYLNGEETDNG